MLRFRGFTKALTNATVSNASELANQKPKAAMAKNKALLKGLDIYKERVTEKGVVDAVGMDYEQPQL